MYICWGLLRRRKSPGLCHSGQLFFPAVPSGVAGDPHHTHSHSPAQHTSPVLQPFCISSVFLWPDDPLNKFYVPPSPLHHPVPRRRIPRSKRRTDLLAYPQSYPQDNLDHETRILNTWPKFPRASVSVCNCHQASFEIRSCVTNSINRSWGPTFEQETVEYDFTSKRK